MITLKQSYAIAGLHDQLGQLQHIASDASRELVGASPEYFQERMIAVLEQIAVVANQAVRALEPLAVEHGHRVVAAECYKEKAA